jgi:CRP-like cAMP-binding protein
MPQRAPMRQNGRSSRPVPNPMDLRDFDVPRYLSLLPLFSDMRADELQRLAGACSLRRLAKGEHMFRAGDPCEEFHVAVLGQIRLYAVSPAGHEKVIQLIGPGGSFGEAVMFTGQPYLVSAQALADALLLTVGKNAVLAEIDRTPRFALRMLAGLSRRLHGLVNDVQSYALQNGAQRVIGYLLHVHAAQQGPDAGATTVALPVSKAAIASRLSLTPEYFSRVLHDLEAAGLIEVDNRDIRIPDLQRLADWRSPQGG